ncbi:fluoride efflux transporter CrcB (plasmid) [Rhodococcus sp. ZPP]|uniref:fluoride efflux transporter CrcB n=1 Tax=Rhodococcus TaxID=1827 RepID=UPI0006BB4B01|nr:MULTISPECIES: fluoride efflux transporter CrcB [Rhodococcus]QHE73656.1 CrcB protein [Rhodococcus sp. WAY2]QTJ71180.1 fluoride efflux transporter CrcB [Rhodococcus sp. ZPP]
MMMLWIACAGSLGAIARFVIDGAIKHRKASEFPWATATINVTGSLLLGFVTGLILFHGVPREIQLIVGVGFCGGYTTFSTASFETARLIQHQQYAAGLANAVGALLLTIVAGGAGLALASV